MSRGAVTLFRSVVADDIIDVACSDKRHGDFHLDGDRRALQHRRASFQAGEWSQPDECHGTTVRRVEHLGQHDGVEADALVTSLRGAVLAIWVGDCAPVAFIGHHGTLGGAHAGWRGAVDGVLAATVREFGTEPVTAVLGPCIHACCYEFGAADLDRCAARFGDGVRAVTAWGTAALDMPAVVRAALAEHGVPLVDRSRCTGCGADRYYSHRRRAERGRQVMTICKRARA